MVTEGKKAHCSDVEVVTETQYGEEEMEDKQNTQVEEANTSSLLMVDQGKSWNSVSPKKCVHPTCLKYLNSNDMLPSRFSILENNEVTPDVEVGS